MLSAGAAAPVGVDTQVFFVDLHVQVFLNIRHDIQRHKGSLPFSLGIEGGNPHQPVHALLGFQITIGICSVDLESHRLDSGFLPIQVIQHFHGKAPALRPAVVHPVEHSAPVTALGAACPGVQFQYGAVFVVFSRKQRTQAQFLQFTDKFVQFGPDIRYQGRVILLIPHLDQRQNILKLPGKLVAALHRAFQGFQFLHFFIGAVRIVPEARGLHLPL